MLDYFVKSLLVSPSEYKDENKAIRKINEFHHDLMWNDMSPIWFRPQYERGKMYKPRKLLQVVGHTPVEKIYREGNVISCDVFSTYRDGRPIGTQEFPVIDTETWEFWSVRCE